MNARVQIGINPLTWSNDDLPSLGSNISLATCLTEAREVGYAGVELGNKFPRDPAVLGKTLQFGSTPYLSRRTGVICAVSAVAAASGSAPGGRRTSVVR